MSSSDSEVLATCGAGSAKGSAEASGPDTAPAPDDVKDAAAPGVLESPPCPITGPGALPGTGGAAIGVGGSDAREYVCHEPDSSPPVPSVRCAGAATGLIESSPVDGAPGKAVAPAPLVPASSSCADDVHASASEVLLAGGCSGICRTRAAPASSNEEAGTVDSPGAYCPRNDASGRLSPRDAVPNAVGSLSACAARPSWDAAWLPVASRLGASISGCSASGSCNALACSGVISPAATAARSAAASWRRRLSSRRVRRGCCPVRMASRSAARSACRIARRLRRVPVRSSAASDWLWLTSVGSLTVVLLPQGLLPCDASGHRRRRCRTLNRAIKTVLADVLDDAVGYEIPDGNASGDPTAAVRG